MITIQENRNKAIYAGCAALEDRIPISYSNMSDYVRDFDVKAIIDGDAPIGMVILKGPEIHIAIIPEYRKRWLSKRLMNEFIAILKKYGYMTTSVMSNHKKGKEFVERMGFKMEKETQDICHYRKIL